MINKKIRKYPNSFEDKIRPFFNSDVYTGDVAIKLNCTQRVVQKWYKRFREEAYQTKKY